MRNRVMRQMVMCAIFVLATTQQSLAQSNQSFDGAPYAGANLGITAYREDYTSYELDATMFAFSSRLGMHFNEYLSGEIRMVLGMNEGDVSVSEGDVSGSFTVKLDASLGAFIRISLPTNSPMVPYVAGGYSASTITASSKYLDQGISDTESSVSFGFGVDIDMENDWFMNGDFTSYFNKDNVAINMFSIGFTRLYR